MNSDATLVTLGDLIRPEALLALLAGRAREVHGAVWLNAALFALRFLFLDV